MKQLALLTTAGILALVLTGCQQGTEKKATTTTTTTEQTQTKNPGTGETNGGAAQ